MDYAPRWSFGATAWMIWKTLNCPKVGRRGAKRPQKARLCANPGVFVHVAAPQLLPHPRALRLPWFPNGSWCALCA